MLAGDPVTFETGVGIGAPQNTTFRASRIGIVWTAGPDLATGWKMLYTMNERSSETRILLDSDDTTLIFAVLLGLAGIVSAVFVNFF